MPGVTAELDPIEYLRQNVNVLTEGIVELSGRLDKQAGIVDRIDERTVDAIKQVADVVEELAKHLHIQQENLADMRVRIDAVGARLDSIDDRIDDLEDR